MKIVYLASVQIPSGKASGLAIVKQCEGFAKLGHYVELIHQRLKLSVDPFSYYGVKKNFNTRTFWVIPFNVNLGLLGFLLTRFSMMVMFSWYVWKKRKKFDVLYSRDQWLLLFPILFFHGPIVWEGHTKHTDFVTRFVLKRAKKVIVISQGLKDFYEEMGHRLDLILAPSGANIEQFEYVTSQAEARELFNIPSSAYVVGYIGKYTTMGEAKGVDELAEAFSLVMKTIDELYLFVVGLEPHEIEVFKKKCHALGIPDYKLSLLPLEQKKFAEYVLCADVVIANYPSSEHYSKFMSPTKLFAYLAGKKVVIASDLPSIRSIAGEAVVYTEPNDIENLAETLKEVLLNQKKYTLLYKKIDIEQFSWNSRAKKIIESIDVKMA